MEKIKANEDIRVVFELERLVGSHLSVQCSLIGQLSVGEFPVEEMIDVTDTTPQLEEAFLEFCVMIVGEVTEEATDDLALLISEV